MKKLIRLIAFLSVSSIAVVSFQNCSQPGKLGLKNTGSALVNDGSGADFVVQVPPTTVPTNDPAASGPSSSGSNTVVNNPPSTNPPSMPSGSSSSSSTNMPSGSMPGGSCNDHSMSSSGNSGSEHELCGLSTSDYKFVFDHLTLQCADSDKKLDIALVSGENVFSLNKNYIVIDMKETRTIECGQLFAYFKTNGNALMKSDGKVVNMSSSDDSKMPKGFIRFPVKTQLMGGQKYKLTLTFDTHKEDVKIQSKSGRSDDDKDDEDDDDDDHGEKECKFKPFFHADITKY